MPKMLQNNLVLWEHACWWLHVGLKQKFPKTEKLHKFQIWR